jgi:hypothetical protein
MADLRDIHCELKIFEGWQPITLNQALSLPQSRIKRCPFCFGQVRALQASTEGAVAYFEHFEPHLGCYLAETFDGNPRPHRKALK